MTDTPKQPKSPQKSGAAKKVALVALFALVAYLAFYPVPVDPVAWNPPPAPGFVGDFAPSVDLSQQERLLPNVVGAEALTFDPQGRLVTGLLDGSILRLEANGTATTLVNTQGRPLGMVHAPGGAGLQDVQRVEQRRVHRMAVLAAQRRFEGLAKAALKQATTKPRTTIDTMLAHGRVADMIAKVAKQKEADLLVVGSRGLSDAEHYLLGSVSRKVSALAPCPVLVVKRPLTSLSHVLFAADTSKHSQGACSFLCKQFLPDSARVTVLSIVEPAVTELASKYLSRDQVEQISAPKRQAAEQLVEKLRARFLAEGYAVTPEVQFDHVPDALLRQATSPTIDLLVAGSRGLTGSERLQLGSVSETLLKYAPCSVLIVRGWRA